MNNHIKNHYNKLLSHFNLDLALDLGSYGIKIYKKDEGLKLIEPSLIATTMNNGVSITICVGKEAKKMLSRNPKGVEVTRPIKGGQIKNPEESAQMLSAFFEKAVGENKIIKPRPRILVPVCNDMTDVTRRLLDDVIISAGAKSVNYLAAPICSALGLGLDISGNTGHLIVDIGFEKTTISVVAFNQIAMYHTIPIGGNNFNNAIIDYLKRVHSIQIGEPTADLIKRDLALAMYYDDEDGASYKISGFNPISSKPKEINVNYKNVHEAINPVITALLTGIQKSFEYIPKDFFKDINENGAYIVGGGANLKHLNDVFLSAFGIKAQKPLRPEVVTINGAGNVLPKISSGGFK